MEFMRNMSLIQYITASSQRSNIPEVYINFIQQKQLEVGGNPRILGSTLGILPNVVSEK